MFLNLNLESFFTTIAQLSTGTQLTIRTADISNFFVFTRLTYKIWTLFFPNPLAWLPVLLPLVMVGQLNTLSTANGLNICPNSCCYDTVYTWVSSVLFVHWGHDPINSDPQLDCIYKVYPFDMLNLFFGYIKLYLHFPQFLKIEMVQIVEIFPHRRQGPVYSVYSIPWLLISWRLVSPGHQQPWYWLRSFGFNTRTINSAGVTATIFQRERERD